MVKRKRPVLAAEAARRNLVQLGRLGGLVREARRRRRWTQTELAGRVGLARSTVSAIEGGHGGGLTLDTWQRVAVALGIGLAVDLGRDPLEAPVDAGHLAIQELVIRLGRAAGYRASFEVPARPTDPGRSTDVGLRDDARRLLVLVECWNTIGDIGAAARSTSRKVAEAEAIAVAVGGDRPYRVASCWVVRASRRNRDLLGRYPGVFDARFPGSSRAWAAALTTGGRPPTEPGLVWSDVGATALFPRRRVTR
jgi:transcriptional regulator with XRE-family HTH domain